MTNEILRVIFHADLRCSHTGLSLIAKKNFKIDTSELGQGQYLVFINTAKTIVKVYTGGNIIAHYKSRHGQINLKTLSLIPKYFNGPKFHYDAALSEVIRKEIRNP